MTFLTGGGGGNDALEDFKPLGFRGGGLTARTSGNDITIGSTPGRRKLVGNLQRTFAAQASQIRGLRGQVTPGFGRLTKARLAEVEKGRKRAVGNLSQNLQNRRIFGSSFGQASLAQAEREFAQESERAAAESFLQELELNAQLLQQEFQARRGAFETALGELNLQAELASRLAATATSELGANARLQTQLQAQNASGFGSLFGTILGFGANLLKK